nr:retrovirus-related Pol polyprotein from transposon TNT 1-94 [Tanacetum cinerariifolium]
MDSDWAGSQDDKRSTTGNCFIMGSGVISWASKKQNSIALSSTEANYVAAATTACQGFWLRRLLEDMNQTQPEATLLLCDNLSPGALTRNPIMHA